MKKGQKTETTNQNIAIARQEGIATRLQTHVDNIQSYANGMAENLFKIGDELILIQEEADFAGTFEEFIKAAFDRKRDWAYKLMESSKARKSLPESVSHEIQNPRQALALAEVPKEKREKVVAAIKESGKVMTGAAITAEAKKQDEAVNTEIVIEYDELNIQIPNEILPEWNRAKEEAKWARGVANELARWFSNGLGDKDKKRDPIFRAVLNSNAKLFTDIKRQIAMVDPYAVCPTCKGSLKVDGKKCKHCQGAGFISKFEYEHAGEDKKEKAPANKDSKIGARFNKFIHAAHGNETISIEWKDERGSVELKGGAMLAFEEKDGEFKLVETQDENLFEG